MDDDFIIFYKKLSKFEFLRYPKIYLNSDSDFIIPILSSYAGIG